MAFVSVQSGLAASTSVTTQSSRGSKNSGTGFDESLDGGFNERDAEEELMSFDRPEENSDGVVDEADEMEISFNPRESHNRSDKAVDDSGFADEEAAPRVILTVPPNPRSSPPPGYTWALRPEWFLAPTDHPPIDQVQQSYSHIQFEDGDGSQCEPASLANMGASNYQEYIDGWVQPSTDFGNIPPRAPAPSPPARVKDEDPFQKELQGVDLYSADDHPGPSTSQQPQVKVEGQEAVDMPPIPRHSHPTRARVRSQRFPFKCFTCNNQFEHNQQLRNHLIKHPRHRGDDIRPHPTQRQSTKSIKKNARRARVQK
jgi:hypothetical protein